MQVSHYISDAMASGEYEPSVHQQETVDQQDREDEVGNLLVEEARKAKGDTTSDNYKTVPEPKVNDHENPAQENGSLEQEQQDNMNVAKKSEEHLAAVEEIKEQEMDIKEINNNPKLFQEKKECNSMGEVATQDLNTSNSTRAGEDTKTVNKAIKEVTEQTMNPQKDEWVAVAYEEGWYPGQVKTVRKALCMVNILHREENQENSFISPTAKDCCSVQNMYIFYNLTTLMMSPDGIKRKLNEKDYTAVLEAYRRYALLHFTEDTSTNDSPETELQAKEGIQQEPEAKQVKGYEPEVSDDKEGKPEAKEGTKQNPGAEEGKQEGSEVEETKRQRAEKKNQK